MTDILDLTEQITALEASLDGTSAVVSAFDGELNRMRDSLVFTTQEVGSLTTGFSSGLRRAFDGVVFDGVKLSDALRGVAKAMADTVFQTAMRPIHSAVGGFLANGVNSLLSNAMPFAKGGVVAQPTGFAMRGGAGLMGEAGPEAIMPLTRGADGRRGVTAGGAPRPVTVVMNISTPDVQGFQRSQSQIAAEAIRALSRGQRNR
jgi:phage-related minor tail protein